MPFVVVTIASEYLSDGSFHMFSPDVPGFHIIDQDRKRTHEQIFHETALPVLEETMTRRVMEAKVGDRVRVRIKEIPLTDVGSFVPAELSQRIRRDHKFSVPKQLIAEIT